MRLKNRFGVSISHSVVGCLGLSMLLLLIAPANPACAYDRMVLIEDFTNTRCGPCYYWAPYFEQAREAFDEDQYVVVAIHAWWPGADDPWWLANQGENRAHINEYGVHGVPSFWVDGVNVQLVNPPNSFVANFIREVDRRLETDSPIAMDARVGIFEDLFHTTVNVTSDEDLNSLKLRLAMVEIYNDYRPPNSNYPPGHHDALLDLIPDNDGTNFSINAGETLSFSFQSPRDIGWDEDMGDDDIMLVAWVQAVNREVHQSFKTPLGVGPYLWIADWEVSDEEEGDGDGRGEAGELVNAYFTLENAPFNEDAIFVDVTLGCEAEGIEIVNGTVEIESIEAGSRADNADEPLQFRVAEDFQPREVAFTVTVNAQPGDFSIQSEYSYMIGWPDVLVVDASSNLNAGRIISELFGSGGLPNADCWDRLDEGVVTGENIENYKVVLWHSFNTEQEVLTPFEAEVLASYLDGGGILILSSTAVLANLGDFENLALHLGVAVDQADVNINFVRGYEGAAHFEDTHLFLGGGVGAGFPDLTTSLVPERDQGTAPVLYYDDHGQDGGIAAVTHRSGPYATLVFGFPIESVGGVGGTDNLATFMRYVWGWVEEELDIPDSPESAPSEFALGAVYPNPFNSSAVVTVSLDRTGKVELGLFDIAGREVARIWDGIVPAGRRTVTLNAGQMGLAAGVYYLRLKSADRTAGQKVVFMR